MGDPVEVIHDRPTRVVAIVVNARNVHEIIEPQFLLRERADFHDAFGLGEAQGDFAAKLRRLGNQISEPGFELFGEVEGVHSWKQVSCPVPAVGINIPFPLTLTLSLGEREQQAATSRNSEQLSDIVRGKICREIGYDSPSPRGRGAG